MGSEADLTPRQRAMGMMFDAMIGVGELYLENHKTTYEGKVVRRIKHYNPRRRGPDVTVFEYRCYSEVLPHWEQATRMFHRGDVKAARRRKYGRRPLSRGFIKMLSVDEAKEIIYQLTDD